MYDLGDTPTLTLNVYDASGAAADGGAVSLTITLPDGTSSGALAPTHGGTGVYTYNYLTTQAGLHQLLWTVTGANAGTHSDVINVEPAGSSQLVSLSEFKSFLGWSQGTDQDDALRMKLIVACDLMEAHTGRKIRRQTVTKTADGDAKAVLLPGPVISITSVSESGSVLAANQYVARSGVLVRVSGYYSYPWRPGIQNVVVTYVAGYLIVPPRIRDGVMELARWLWETRRGNSPRQGPDDEYDDVSMFPQRVQTLIVDLQTAGFAGS